jgi:hypothetical protein
MAYEKEIELLEREWSPDDDDGFFWCVRQGRFDEDKLQRVLRVLSEISLPEDACLPRRLVSLLWFIPIFMEWQVDRVNEMAGDPVRYRRAVGGITGEIERLLGGP